MLGILLPSIIIYVFSVFNLIGIKKELLFIHLFYFAVGLVGFILVRYIGNKFFKQNSIFFYWFFVGMLIVTYIIGAEVKGSQRWIDLGFTRFQPSEFFKIFFILFLADFYSRKRRFDNASLYFLKGFIYFLIPTFIIFKEPDLGSAMVLVVIYIVMTLFSGIPKKYIFYLILITTLTLPVSWHFLHDYQKSRFLAFVNFHIKNENASYNMTQAIITSGSGQIAGRGLAMGKQSKLYFLPEYHTDFAFSSLVEQFGFVGGGTVIALYLVISFFILYKLYELYKNFDTHKFQFLYIAGFFSFVFFQIVVNVGMNLGIVPIAGITLPLVSYGGSSLIAFFIGLGFMFE